MAQVLLLLNESKGRLLLNNFLLFVTILSEVRGKLRLSQRTRFCVATKLVLRIRIYANLARFVTSRIKRGGGGRWYMLKVKTVPAFLKRFELVLKPVV